MALTSDQLASVAKGGGNVLDSDGDKIGGIGQIYLDDQTDEPTWVTARTGLFGTSESFVPIAGATVSGSDIVVQYGKDTVKGAPRVDADGHLTPEEEDSLYTYYGLGGSDVDAGRVAGAGYDRGADYAERAGYDQGADRAATWAGIPPDPAPTTR